MESNSASRTSEATIADRIALGAIALGALTAVLVVLPYRSFDLDRFFVPKELALHAAALVVSVIALFQRRRVPLDRADLLLFVWLLLSALSGLFATNHWLAFRAFGLSASAAALFWAGRRLGDVGLGHALATILAGIVTLGALTALAQAYGIKMEFASLSRAPGGTFGNRNFMAHLAAAGVPLVIYQIATTRRWAGAALGSVALAICAGALVLSRTRAAWLALAMWGLIAFVLILRGPALFDTAAARRRLIAAMVAVAAGVGFALALPNSLDWKSDNPYLDSVKGVVNYKEGSGHGRLLQYKNSALMAAAHPVFGVGAGNWAVVYPKFAPSDDASLSDASGMTANPWPSSDWVAAASERGPLAALTWAVLMLTLLLGGASVRYDPDRTPGERVAAFAGASVLFVTALEGGFDAVLLLPVNAIVVWAAVGALLPRRERAHRVVLSPTLHSAGAVIFALLAAAAIFVSTNKIQAMALYTKGTTASVEAASRRDPGSFRIQMRAADNYMFAGKCANARQHALAARALFPNAPAPKRILAQCPGK